MKVFSPLIDSSFIHMFLHDESKPNDSIGSSATLKTATDMTECGCSQSIASNDSASIDDNPTMFEKKELNEDHSDRSITDQFCDDPIPLYKHDAILGTQTTATDQDSLDLNSIGPLNEEFQSLYLNNSLNSPARMLGWGHNSFDMSRTTRRNSENQSFPRTSRSFSEIMKLNSVTARQLLLSEMKRSDNDTTSSIQFEFKRTASLMQHGSGNDAASDSTMKSSGFNLCKTKLSSGLKNLLLKDLERSRSAKRRRTT